MITTLGFCEFYLQKRRNIGDPHRRVVVLGFSWAAVIVLHYVPNRSLLR